MGHFTDPISQYYDSQAQHEWERMDRHPTEFAVTLRALDAHLPPAPGRILDCGGGPGHYAIELARLGYQVTLFDLSAGNLRLAEEKARQAGVTLAGFEQGTATDLSRFPDRSFDAVLLMGPLYHLLEHADRIQALAEAARTLKPGGPLFAAFISRYAGHIDLARRRPEDIVKEWEISENILSAGQLPLRSPGAQDFLAYLAHPGEVEPLCRAAGLDVLAVLGVEGLVNTLEEGMRGLSKEVCKRWVEVNYRVATDPSIHGGVGHLLAVAVKPRWKAVLRQVVGRLSEAGIPYKVVGGASAALQGVPIRVKDIDIEVAGKDAYRIQALYANQIEMPVEWREADAFRSHYGRFMIDGVQVEVMGDLERPQGGGWVSTSTSTEGEVDLEGVPVRVSWLEEEVLAYIRRGRLDRAGICLPHCRQERMLALLRREQGTNVI